MKNYSKLVIGLVFLLFLFFRINTDFPITLDEAKEGYTAYSILKTGRDTNGDLPGLFFRSNNNYLSSLGVYFRVPTIYLFGLTEAGVRLPSVVFGLITIYFFWLVSREVFRNKNKALVATLLLLVSPLFVQINIFDLGLTSAILFVLSAFYFLIRKKRGLFFVSCSMAILSSLSTIPIILALIFFDASQKGGVKAVLVKVLLILVLALLAFKTNQGLANYLVRNTIIKDLHPSSYTYLIDKKLSFGKILSSPLITEKLNFNRIAHNKAFYGARELFKSLILPFDFERISSSFQSKTILEKERIDSTPLPKFMFWEIPMVFMGLFLLFKKKDLRLVIFATGALASLLLFKEKALIFVLPLVIFAETAFIFFLKDKVKPTYLRASILIIALVMVFSYLSFFDLLWFHQDLWFSEDDLRQWQIWRSLTDEDLKRGKIVITDRLGEPVDYFLFYKKVDPDYYLEQRKLGVITDSGIQRIEKVGNIEFGSFKYFEAPREPDQIWIGMAGEFVGKNKDFSEIVNVPDGKIIKKIYGVKQKDRFLGDELWFVKTTTK